MKTKSLGSIYILQYGLDGNSKVYCSDSIETIGALLKSFGDAGVQPDFVRATRIARIEDVPTKSSNK
jgi:hypothetical protein